MYPSHVNIQHVRMTMCEDSVKSRSRFSFGSSTRNFKAPDPRRFSKIQKRVLGAFSAFQFQSLNRANNRAAGCRFDMHQDMIGCMMYVFVCLLVCVFMCLFSSLFVYSFCLLVGCLVGCLVGWLVCVACHVVCVLLSGLFCFGVLSLFFWQTANRWNDAGNTCSCRHVGNSQYSRGMSRYVLFCSPIMLCTFIPVSGPCHLAMRRSFCLSTFHFFGLGPQAFQLQVFPWLADRMNSESVS